jgi:enoyl-[acyl-carrier-protein] reductase (NADH)
MLSIDLTGKRALVAGVADDAGYGFAIAKALAEAGATVCTGTWPPALNIFNNLLERGKIDAARRMPDGSLLAFERIYPLDAAYDTLADAPEDIRTNKRYREVGDFSVEGLAQRLVADFGERPLDILVHSLANGPEVKKPLLETSRAGYLAAVGVSAYSLTSLVARLGPRMRPGGSALSLTYLASERVVRLRRWHVIGQGGFEATPAPWPSRRVAGTVPGPPSPLVPRLARRQRDRVHPDDDRVLPRKLAPAPRPRRGGSRHHRRIPRESAGLRHHRYHGLRGQRVSLDGHVGTRRS